MEITMESVKTLRASTGAGIVDCRNALVACDGDVDAAMDWLREKGIAKAAKKASRIAAEGITAIATSGNFAAIVEVNSETDFVAKNEKFVALVKEIARLVVENKPATMEEALAANAGEGTVNDLIVSATATIGEKISFRRFDLVSKKDDEVFGTYIHNGSKIGVVAVLKGSDVEMATGIAMHVAALAPQYVSMEDIPQDVVEHERSVQMAAAKNDPSLAGKPENILKNILEGKVRKTLGEGCLLEQEYCIVPGSKVGAFVKAANSAVLSFVRYNVGEGLEKRTENFAEEVMSQIK